MIFDSIKNHELYLNAHPLFKQGFDFILDNPEIEDGTYTLIENELIVHVISKETKLEGDAQLEYHKNFIDLQYVMEGKEICGISSKDGLENLGDYDASKDLGFLKCDKDSSQLEVSKEQFYIVWPNEPHRPLGAVNNQPNFIRKIVIKVAV